MGIADTSAAPMIGFIFYFKNKLPNLTLKIPPAVEKIKAIMANPTIKRFEE